MTDDTEAGPARPALMATFPQLFVTDIRRSCAFFETRLGFATVFTHGEPPFYAQVGRDAVRLNLRHVDKMPFLDDVREEGDLLAAYICVDDIAALHAEMRAAGASLHQPLRREPWGARDFVVRDPDGNLILFADR